MKCNKIEALLSLKGTNQTALAKFMNITRQGLNTKKKNDTYNADDLIKVAEFTNTRLCYVDEKGKVLIEFDADDLRNKDKNSNNI